MFSVLSISGLSKDFTWQLAVSVFLDAASATTHGNIHVSLPELSVSEAIPVESLDKGEQKMNLPLLNFTKKDDIQEWWPSGYGKQSLYTVKVGTAETIACGNSTLSPGQRHSNSSS